ncbi:MAG: urease accessory UreF family protein [Pseudomonadota bacterium]
MLRLAAWLSPAYPIGSFAWSHGLEARVAEGAVTGRATLERWIADLLCFGAGRSDAILVAHAYRAGSDAVALAGLSALAGALAPSAERLRETTALGTAFAAVTAASWGGPGITRPYPVALGEAAAASRLPLEPTLAFFLQTLASSQISAGIRLIPLGQTDGQRVLAALLPLCRTVAAEAATAGLEDLGGSTILGDIASMRHEDLPVRLFQS